MSETEAFTERERAALERTEEVTDLKEQVQESAFGAVREHFDEKEVVDLTVAIASIGAWNRLGEPFRAEWKERPAKSSDVAETAGSEGSDERAVVGDDGGRGRLMSAGLRSEDRGVTAGEAVLRAEGLTQRYLAVGAWDGRAGAVSRRLNLEVHGGGDGGGGGGRAARARARCCTCWRRSTGRRRGRCGAREQRLSVVFGAVEAAAVPQPGGGVCVAVPLSAAGVYGG